MVRAAIIKKQPPAKVGDNGGPRNKSARIHLKTPATASEIRKALGIGKRQMESIRETFAIGKTTAKL